MVGATMAAEAAYTRTAIALHWFAALLIVGNLALGVSMVDLELSPLKLRLFSYHKWIGITVFLVASLRLLLRQVHPPPPPVPMQEWQRRAATATHAALYVLMFAVPLSGWIYSSATGVSVVYLGLVPLPDLVAKDKGLASVLKAVHVTLNLGLVALIAVHFGAALRHLVAERDNVLPRMLPFLRRS